MKRKIFAAFLSLMMVISMLPTSAFATEVDVPADCQHANAHWETVKEATCTEPGKEVLHCHECEKDLDEKEIPALGHDLQPTGVFVDPTCTEGAGETYACSRCDHTETKVIEGDAAIPALGHDMKETVVTATCKEGGYTLHECQREGCDYSYKDHETPADENAHVSVLREPALKPATCTTTGIGQYVCEVCGKSLGYKVIPAGHKMEEVAREDATCGKDGKVTYACANCDATEEEVLPATGKHTFVNGKKIEATCTENAKVGQVCSVCGAAGETVEQPDTALGHDMVADDEKSVAATCEKAGVAATKCSRCDYTETKEIPALGHKWLSDGMQEADCTNAAGEKFVCANDPEHVKVVAFEGELAQPALGHKPETIPAVAADCSNTGLTEGTICSVCHKVLVEPQVTPKDESKHSPVEASVLKPATCTTNGIARMECQLCGKNLGYKVISDGHDWSVELDRVDATCAEAGKITWGCSKCDETKEEVLPATGEHDYQETYVDATCTSNAKAGYVCTACGAEKDVEEIPGTMLEHELKVDEKASKAATCEEDGVEVLKCANCDYTESKVVKALGHKWESAGMQEADCTNAAGEKFVCANDSEHVKVVAFEGELAEPAKGHTPKAIPAVAATCKTTGLTEGSECAVCHEILVKQEETPLNKDAHVPVVAKELKKAICGEQNGINRMECELCHENLGYVVVDASEHKPVESSRVEATCGEVGVINYVCERCGAELESEEIPATGEHPFIDDDDHVRYVEATCTENEKLVHICPVCGAEGEEVSFPDTALGHDWELNKSNPDYKAVTCEEDGLDTFECKRCHETKTEVVKASGKHAWDEGTDVDAGCTTASGAKYTCTKCGATKFEEYPEGIGEPAKGHTPVAIPAVAATCKTTGLTEGSKCSVCQEILVKQEETPLNKDAHVPVVAKELKKAICGEQNGINRMECELCHENLGYVVVDASEHKPVESSRVEATCGEAGVINYICERCGAELESEEIPATGEHTFIDDNDHVRYVEATCTENQKVVHICTVCGAEGDEVPVPDSALGHDWELNKSNPDYKAVTCEEDGLDTFECKRCHETKTEVVKASGSHTWDMKTAVNVPASCTEDEHMIVECSVCHATKPEAYPDGIGQKALGHDLKKAVTPATCAKEGYTTVTCSRCDYNEITDKTPVDANNHTWNITHLKAASCTATGIDRLVCADCGTSKYVVAEKAPHTYDPKNEKVTKEPTCAEEGEISNTCTVCGKTEVVSKVSNEGIEHTPVEIPETDDMTAGVKCSVCGEILLAPESKCAHKNTETLAKVNPTCTETGLTEGKKCADCGKVLVEQETIPATGHTEEVVAAVAPTCTATGLTEGKKCSVCGETLVEQDVVAALGHVEEVLEGVAPTCETAGKTAGVKCSRCGEILLAQEDIAAKGHTPVDVAAVEATCETTGKTAGTKCSVCEKVLSGCEEIAALGHDYQYVEDGEDEEGLWVKYECTRCHDTKIDR